MIFRICVVTILLAVGLSGSANAGLLEFLFPSLRDEGPNPSETLQAPFADHEAQNDPTKRKPENAVSLELPHRSTPIITQWVITEISNVMSFDKPDVREELAEEKAFFDAGGHAEYMAFLRDAKIADVLKSGKYMVRSYVQDSPVLLNEGAVEGRYRWLYEVPVQVSYLQHGTADYENAEPVNQDIVVRVQIGRTADAENELALRMERWTGIAR